MNTKHEIELQDGDERHAFNQFILMIQNYRNAQWVKNQAVSEPSEPDTTGTTEPAEDETQVIAHIQPELTYDDIFTKLKQYVASHTTTEGRALLDAFQINRLPELPKERYAEFAARCDEVLVTA